MNDFEQLSARVRKNPDDLEGWKGLLVLVDDPRKKEDCQKQIDRINIKHQSNSLICPQCGAGMNIYFSEGQQNDKRAKCPYCGTDVDLPDSNEQRTDKVVAILTTRDINNTIWGKSLLGSLPKSVIVFIIIFFILPFILPIIAMILDFIRFFSK